MQLLLHALSHLLVDAVCAAALFGGIGEGEGLARLIALYSTLAFSTQCLVGLAADRVHSQRIAVAASMVCVALGFALPLSGLFRVILLGLGNSVFHVSAGTVTLRGSGFRAAPLGVFVAPGAIGLTLGTCFPAWGPVLTVLLLLAAAVCLLPTAQAEAPAPPTPASSVQGAKKTAAVLLLTAAVAVRAVGGAAVRFPWQDGVWPTLLATFFVFSGKLTGGFLCDHVGARRAAWCSIPAAALLIAFCGAWMMPSLLGQLALNLTMPITLWLLYRAMPEAPGFAFGVAASALWPGTLAGRYIEMTGPLRWVFLMVCFLFGLWAILYAASRDRENPLHCQEKKEEFQ